MQQRDVFHFSNAEQHIVNQKQTGGAGTWVQAPSIFSNDPKFHVVNKIPIRWNAVSELFLTLHVCLDFRRLVPKAQVERYLSHLMWVHNEKLLQQASLSGQSERLFCVCSAAPGATTETSQPVLFGKVLLLQPTDHKLDGMGPVTKATRKIDAFQMITTQSEKLTDGCLFACIYRVL